MSITIIVLPTRPQPDTIVAIFILKQFGESTYPGVSTATITVDPQATEADGKLLLDVGGGELDHHGSDTCATELVTRKLALTENKAFRQLLAYARRDDTEGKGTISNDPLDRAFGLSGLIAALNKQNPNDPQLVVDSVLPLLSAHYYTADQQYNVLPKLVETLQTNNQFTTHTFHVPLKNLKVALLTSDEVGLPGYLRSQSGGNYRIVVQRRSSGHVNIITKQNPKLDVARLAALIRLQEANLQQVEINNEQSLFTTGQHPAVPNWYYDPATNSLLNGGVTPDAIAPTTIDWNDLTAIITHTIPELAVEQKSLPVKNKRQHKK